MQQLIGEEKKDRQRELSALCHRVDGVCKEVNECSKPKSNTDVSVDCLMQLGQLKESMQQLIGEEKKDRQRELSALCHRVEGVCKEVNECSKPKSNTDISSDCLMQLGELSALCHRVEGVCKE